MIAIRNLCLEINKYGRQINKGRFKLHVSVNILIPKAHTPYQWAAFESRESSNQKFELIINDLRKQKIKVDYPDYDAASLEAVLSRGGREISDVIFYAWEKGARFDAWREGFSPEIWDDAFINAEIKPADLISKEKPLENLLPWDHIDSGVNKSFLKSEYTHAINGQVTPGCFEHCQACGIQSSFLLSCKKNRAGSNAS